MTPSALAPLPAVIRETAEPLPGRVTVTLQFRDRRKGAAFCNALRDCQQRGEDVGLVVFARGVPVEEAARDNQ